MLYRKLGIQLFVAAAIAASVAPSADAGSASLSKAKAIKAVEREVRSEYDWSRVLDVTCNRLTAKRFRCKFSGLTHDDDINGETGGHSGKAAVTKYSEGVDVVLSGYQTGGR